MMDKTKTANILLIVAIILLVILVVKAVTAPTKHTLSADGKTFEPVKTKSGFLGFESTEKE